MTKWNTNLVNFPGLTLMSITLLLSGCATPFWGGYDANGQSREEFTRYVEGVFRLQNSMTSEIMAFSHYLQDLDRSGFKNLTGLAKITCASIQSEFAPSLAVLHNSHLFITLAIRRGN